MNVKKCDNCERVQRDNEDPQYEWFTVADGVDAGQVKAEVCSKGCVIAWVDWRIEVRAEIDKELEASVA